MSRWRNAGVYFGLLSKPGEAAQPVRWHLLRFLAQILVTLALMLACTWLLRAVGVEHETASWVGIAIGAFVGSLVFPVALKQGRGWRSRRGSRGQPVD